MCYVVRHQEELFSKFKVTAKVQQGCVLSPVLFNVVMDRVLRQTLQKCTVGGIKIAYRTDGGLFREQTVDGTHKSNVPCMLMYGSARYIK